ncbi:hypothetical protein CYMTET_53568, partial [Cymbomonas tetramitiformis]
MYVMESLPPVYMLKMADTTDFATLDADQVSVAPTKNHNRGKRPRTSEEQNITSLAVPYATFKDEYNGKIAAGTNAGWVGVIVNATVKSREIIPTKGDEQCGILAICGPVEADDVPYHNCAGQSGSVAPDGCSLVSDVRCAANADVRAQIRNALCRAVCGVRRLFMWLVVKMLAELGDHSSVAWLLKERSSETWQRQTQLPGPESRPLASGEDSASEDDVALEMGASTSARSPGICTHSLEVGHIELTAEQACAASQAHAGLGAHELHVSSEARAARIVERLMAKLDFAREKVVFNMKGRKEADVPEESCWATGDIEDMKILYYFFFSFNDFCQRIGQHRSAFVKASRERAAHKASTTMLWGLLPTQLVLHISPRTIRTGFKTALAVVIAAVINAYLFDWSA